MSKAINMKSRLSGESDVRYGIILTSNRRHLVAKSNLHHLSFSPSGRNEHGSSVCLSSI